jgi:predicted RNase H-like nuclease
MLVVGLDGCRTGWVAIALENGKLAGAALIARASDALATWPELTVLAIDIPIGLPSEATAYRRQADAEARKRLLARRSTVFPTPPREVLAEETYAGALARSIELVHKGLSRQAYALRDKILEVDELARSDGRVREIHPEISFTEMAQGRVDHWYPKKTWNGLAQRRRCLEEAGLILPDKLERAGLAGADDVVDAAAAAWSAWRIATGQAGSLPDPPEIGDDGERIAIWY